MLERLGPDRQQIGSSLGINAAGPRCPGDPANLLNKQRDAVEARYKRQEASENLSKYQQIYANSRAALESEQAAKFDMPVGTGGRPEAVLISRR